MLRLADHVLVVRQVLAGLRSAPLQACDLRHKDLPAYYEEWGRGRGQWLSVTHGGNGEGCGVGRVFTEVLLDAPEARVAADADFRAQPTVAAPRPPAHRRAVGWQGARYNGQPAALPRAVAERLVVGDEIEDDEHLPLF